MNFAAIKTHDVANGPGVRVSLFVSGCTHYCKGCFNQEAWDFDYGRPFDAAAEEEILNAFKAAGILKASAFWAAKPFEPPTRKPCCPLCSACARCTPIKPCGATPVTTLKKTC